MTGTIDAQRLAELLSANEGTPVLVDVRTPGEFTAVHVPGSRCIPLDDLTAADDDDLRTRFTGQPVILLCRTDRRAQLAQERLLRAGIDSTVLTGGIREIQRAHPTLARKGASTWAMDRQVRMVAGSLVIAGFLGGKLLHPAIGYVAGAVGTGLAVSAATDSCLMGSVLSKMPWNRRPADPALTREVQQIPVATVPLTNPPSPTPSPQASPSLAG